MTAGFNELNLIVLTLLALKPNDGSTVMFNIEGFSAQELGGMVQKSEFAWDGKLQRQIGVWGGAFCAV